MSPSFPGETVEEDEGPQAPF
jgi:hypothetical protein